MISPCPSVLVLYRIVMLAAEHLCGRKAGTELDTPDGRYRKYGMTQGRLYRIKKRLSQASRQSCHPALDNAPDTVFCIDGFLQAFFNVLLSSDLQNGGDYAQPTTLRLSRLRRGCYPCQQLLSHHARCHEGHGQPSGKMPAAPVILEAAEFLAGHEIRMSRTRHGPLLLIIARPRILVLKKYRDRRTRGPPVKDPALEHGQVIFLTRGSPFLGTAFTPFQVRQEIVQAYLQAGRTSVDVYADTLPMRLAKYGYSE